MGLLVKCEKCNCLYMPGTSCPNCNTGGGDDTGDVAGEYARRKEQHKTAYTAFMCRGMAGGIAGLVMFVWFIILTFRGWRAFDPLVLLVAGGLLLFAAAISVVAHMYLIKNKDCLEVHCPACDTRVDEFPIENGCCPGCNVKLCEPRLQ
jgi:hypothetical protein